MTSSFFSHPFSWVKTTIVKCEGSLAGDIMMKIAQLPSHSFLGRIFEAFFKVWGQSWVNGKNSCNPLCSPKMKQYFNFHFRDKKMWGFWIAKESKMQVNWLYRRFDNFSLLEILNFLWILRLQILVQDLIRLQNKSQVSPWNIYFTVLNWRIQFTLQFNCFSYQIVIVVM